MKEVVTKIIVLYWSNIYNIHMFRFWKIRVHWDKQKVKKIISLCFDPRKCFVSNSSKSNPNLNLLHSLVIKLISTFSCFFNTWRCLNPTWKIGYSYRGNCCDKWYKPKASTTVTQATHALNKIMSLQQMNLQVVKCSF